MADVAAPHDEVRFARQHGGGQVRDVGARVLVVGVGADDDVGPPGQRRVDGGPKGRGQAQVALVPHDAIDAVGAGHLGGVVARAVVHHQRLEPVGAGYLAGKLRQRNGQRSGFVVARYDYRYFQIPVISRPVGRARRTVFTLYHGRPPSGQTIPAGGA